MEEYNIYVTIESPEPQEVTIIDPVHATKQDLSDYATKDVVNNISKDLTKKADLVTGKNLFNINDPENILDRYVNASNGTLAANVLYNATHFIKVNGGENYRVSFKHMIAFYDIDKVYVAGSPTSISERTLSIPVNVHFIRCSVEKVEWAKFQFEEGIVSTSWEAYAIHGLDSFAHKTELGNYALSSVVNDIVMVLEEKSDKVVGKNLFNINDTANISNRFISEVTGAVMNGNSSYLASHFIEVEAGQTYALSYGNRTAWYDESKVFLSGVNSSSKIRTAPDNASFIRVTTNNVATFQIEKGTIPSSFEPFMLMDLKDVVGNFLNKDEAEQYVKRSLFGSVSENDFLNTFKVEVSGEVEPIFSENSAGWYNTTSVFSGWGTPIGTPQNFNVVKIRVRARATAITEIRLRVYEVDTSGSVLADVTMAVFIPAGESQYVVCPFDEIANSTGAKLYLMYNCNQLSDRWGLSNGGAFMPVSEGYGNPRYVTNGTMTAVGGPSTNGVEKTWVGIIAGATVIGFTPEAISNLREKLGLSEGFTPTAELLLPSRIYAAEGVQSNIFWDNVIFANYPVSELSIDVTCSLGAQLERGWRYTPTGTASNATLNLTVSFDGKEIASASTVVVTRAASEGVGTKKVLAVGDSTTAGGQYVSIINADYGVNPTVTFLGKQGSGANKHEGHSGKTFSWFRGSDSPFWNGTEISFANYLTANGWTMGANDLISIHLGINDVFSSVSTTKLNQMKTDCDALIANFRAAAPGVNIAVCVTIPPSISQDAFGASYQNDQTLDKYLVNYRALVRFMLATYDTSEMRADKIFTPQFNCNVDRTYNFPQSEVAANSRTTKTVTRWTNGVHPANDGYYQMGDVLWAFIKSI